jgi:phage baseplate assembly protein W|tara:strand:- start:656 stop:1018 length:363 start_codon:yes stop_codon:yes gene_type:complete
MVTYIGYSTIDSISGAKTLVDSDLAKRDLLNHFYTRRGERVADPTFGSILPDLVFDPLDERTERLALDDVDKIVNNDPRWNVLETLLSKPTEHSLEIKVRLEYINTGSAEELLLNFVGEE